jgi:hypothetical protein
MCGCGEREILGIVITITIFSQSIPFTGDKSSLLTSNNIAQEALTAVKFIS